MDIINAEHNFLSLVKKYVSESFDLKSDRLVKVAIFNERTREKYVVFLTHHIIVDGMSLDIILHRLIRIYNNAGKIEVSNILQVKDYSEWLNSHSHQEISRHQKNNTRTKILNLDNELGQIREHCFYFSLVQYNKLKEISGNNKTAVFISVMSLLSMVFNKIYQQKIYAWDLFSLKEIQYN
ncbi:MAG: condensation domain-containing protein [Chryseobacterium jejuense]|uniref:condensation domain-containing protein n=1 Tax=Chryseobacterium jejuense TaxID=445960 RepID=UPI003D0FAEC1